MADLALTNTDELEVFDSVVATQHTAVAGVDISAGQLVKLDTDGRWELADASTDAGTANVYLAGMTKPAGQPVTGFKTVKVDGFDLDDLDIGDSVYASDTAGAISDTPGTSVLKVGSVIGGMSEVLTSTPKKILQINIVGDGVTPDGGGE